MRINTNVAALNAHRNLTITQTALSGNMAKLSSGFRINRAADDAAGLGVANQLRASIRALGQAHRNAEQGNSLLQIAEGATGTIQRMLERMKELATQAGSDTVDDAGRSRITAEYEQLRDEINRVVETTKFQGTHLLKNVEAQEEAAATATGVGGVEGNGGVASVDVDNATVVGDYRVYRDGADAFLELDVDGTWTQVASAQAGGTLEYQGIVIELEGAGSPGFDDIPAVGSALTFSVDTAYQAAQEAEGGPRTFLIGASGEYEVENTGDFIKLDGQDLRVATLGVGALDLSTAESARAALDVIDAAMDTVNGVLGDIGAFQNRIETAMENLKTAIQNFAAAESVIRDVDMAEEMTSFTKHNILVQAGTAMLAQANQSTQTVLQLLRG